MPGRLMPSPSSRRQLFFSLTQPPARGAELALDDIVFRNCGLEGESHIHWDEARAEFPREIGLGFAPGGSSPTARCVLGTPCPGQDMGWVARDFSNPGKDVGGAQHVPGALWGQPHADSVSHCPQSPGNRSVGQRRTSVARAPAWHSTASATAPTTVGMARMRIQRGAVSIPGPKEGILPTGPRLHGWAEGLPWQGCGAGRVHPSCAPWLCSQGGKITSRVLWRGQPITGTSLGHSALPPSLQSPSPSAPSSKVSATGRQRLGNQRGGGT